MRRKLIKDLYSTSLLGVHRTFDTNSRRAVPSAGAEGAAAPARKTQFVSNITLITRKSTN